MLFFPKKRTRFSFGGQTENKQISLILQMVGFRLCKSLFAVVLYLLRGHNPCGILTESLSRLPRLSNLVRLELQSLTSCDLQGYQPPHAVQHDKIFSHLHPNQPFREASDTRSTLKYILNSTDQH